MLSFLLVSQWAFTIVHDCSPVLIRHKNHDFAVEHRSFEFKWEIIWEQRSFWPVPCICTLRSLTLLKGQSQCWIPLAHFVNIWHTLCSVYWMQITEYKIQLVPPTSAPVERYFLLLHFTKTWYKFTCNGYKSLYSSEFFCYKISLKAPNLISTDLKTESQQMKVCIQDNATQGLMSMKNVSSQMDQFLLGQDRWK